MTKAHAAVCLVELENDHVDLIANITELRRMLDLLLPAQVRNMDKSVDALLHLDKQAEVGEVAHLTAVLRLHREFELDVVPWVWNELLHAQAHLPLLAVHAQDDGLDLVSHFEELLSAAQVLTPAHFADVQQTFDSFRHFDEGSVVCHNHHFSFDLVSDIDAF